jgi:hypothetical protein
MKQPLGTNSTHTRLPCKGLSIVLPLLLRGVLCCAVLCCTLSTLPQAYGARNFAMMSVTLVRAQLVCAVAVLPTLLLWGSGRLAQLLPALGQQADIAEPASR